MSKSKIVAPARPFPWTCFCGSHEVIIEPQNDPADLQWIKVTCKDCKREWFTTGGLIRLNDDGTWEDVPG